MNKQLQLQLRLQYEAYSVGYQARTRTVVDIGLLDFSIRNLAQGNANFRKKVHLAANPKKIACGFAKSANGKLFPGKIMSVV